MYNEILAGRHQNLLTKLFGMVGGSPAPQLAPEVQPGVDLNVQRSELDLLQGLRWCRAGDTGAPGVANFSRVGLINPANSGLLVIVTSMEVSVVVAGLAYLQRRAGTLVPATTSTQNRHMDTRIDGTSSGTLPPVQLRTGNDVDAPGANAVPFSVLRMPAASIVSLPLFAVLQPGNYIEVCHNTANTAIDANFVYYYRPATAAELSNPIP